MSLLPEVMCEIIMSGVHDRFPELQFLGVETDVGWVPAASIQRLPSDDFHSNWACTFIRDRVGIVNRDSVGVPAKERRASCAGNLIRIYGLPHGGDA